MIGDKHKPQSTFGRWIEAFWDGARSKTKKGKTRIPSLVDDKKYTRRWRRRKEKIDLKDEISGQTRNRK